MNQSQRRIYLIQYLLNEQEEKIEIPHNSQEQKRLLRALMNIRPAKPIDSNVLEIQDAYLQEEIKKKGIVSFDTNQRIILRQGDITRLSIDAIVNAGNTYLTGCYHPNHGCIDNCIHTYSGMQLRLACQELMDQQGHLEPTGDAKCTLAYNLPSKYIFHTVGPIVHGPLTSLKKKELESCYQSCLELAVKKNCSSIAFPCISTGEFHFPNVEAAKIAIHTVQSFLKENQSIRKVVFNVYKDLDKEIYRDLLERI